MKNQRSDEFPYRSNYIDIKGSQIHYIDCSASQKNETVFLFLHGNPTSSYLWRNIIPHVISHGRCIAPDLIGFGKSDKPDIDYSFQEHLSYITSFIDKLNLKNIIFVIHDWGGAIGFEYSRLNPHKIKGIAFMETFYKPMEWSSLDPFGRWLFKKIRNPRMGRFLNGNLNLFVHFILPFSIVRRLSKKEKETYKKPFLLPESRKPIIKFPQELPFNESVSPNRETARLYYEWLQRTRIPKLLLYANPGALIQSENVAELNETLLNLTSKYIGGGKHYIQEDQPDAIGKAIQNWIRDLDLVKHL